EPLAHAARKGADALVCNLGEPDMAERRLDFLLALSAFQSHQPRGVAQILRRGEIIVEADLVGQVADPTLHRQRLAHPIAVAPARAHVRNSAQPKQHQSGGGLAGAIRNKPPEDLSPRQEKRNAVADGYAVVALGDFFPLDDVHRRPNHPPAPIMTRSPPPMSAM